MGVIKETIRRILIFLYYELIIKVKEEIKDIYSSFTPSRIQEFFNHSFKPNTIIVLITSLIFLNLYWYGLVQRMVLIIILSSLLIFYYLYKRWTIGEWLGWYRKKKEIQRKESP